MNMDKASFEAFKAQGYNRIPVVREILADTDTPLSFNSDDAVPRKLAIQLRA